MRQENIIKLLKKQGFVLRFNELTDGDNSFCHGVAFPKEAPYEGNEALFRKHAELIKTITKAEWNETKKAQTDTTAIPT